MRMYIRCLLVLGVLLVIPRLSGAVSYYFSAVGLDARTCVGLAAGAGDNGNACQNMFRMNEIANTMNAGDALYLRCGDNFRPITHKRGLSVTTRSGTVNSRILMSSYGSCTFDSFGMPTNPPVICGTGPNNTLPATACNTTPANPFEEGGVPAIQLIRSHYWTIEKLEMIGYKDATHSTGSQHLIVRLNNMHHLTQACFQLEKSSTGPTFSTDHLYEQNEIHHCGIFIGSPWNSNGSNNGEGGYLGTNETCQAGNCNLTDFSGNITLRNNYFHHTQNEGFQTKPGFGQLIAENNTFDQCNLGKAFAGCIHLSGAVLSTPASLFRNNWVKNTPGGTNGETQGTTTEGGSGVVVRGRNVTINNNLIELSGTTCTPNSKTSGGHCLYVGDGGLGNLQQQVLFTHNTCYDNCNFGAFLNAPEGTITLQDNIYSGNGGTTSLDDIGNDIPDFPELVDAPGGNFNPTAASVHYNAAANPAYGVHRGAFQTLTISSAEIGAVSPNTLVITWVAGNPIDVCTAGGFTVTAGTARTTSSCAIVGTTQTWVVFSGAAVTSNQTPTVTITEGTVKAGSIGTPKFTGQFHQHRNRLYTEQLVTNNTGGTTAPSLASCAVWAGSANRLRVFLNTGVASGNVQPLSGAITFTARRAGAAWALAVPATGGALYTANQRYDFTMATSAVGGEAIDVTYVAGNVTGPTGVPLVGFVNQSCTNQLVVPTFQNATVSAAAPNVVTVSMDSAGLQLMSADCALGWTITGHTISSCAFVGLNQLALTLTAPFVNGEAARTISYNQGTGDVTDGTTELATVTTQPITNNVTALVAPTFSSCRVDAGSANHLHITFNPANSSPMLPATAATTFTARKAAGAWTVTSCAVEGQNAFDCTMSTSATSGQALDASWASGNVTNTAGTPPTAFSQQSCTNNLTTPPTAPVFVNALVEAGNAGIVLVTVDPAAGTMQPDTGCLGFTVSGGTVQDCNRVLPTQFALLVSPAFIYGDVRTVSYDQGVGNVTNGTTELATITAQPITNSLPNPGGAFVLTYAASYCRQAEVAGETVTALSALFRGICSVVPGYRLQVISQINCTPGSCPGSGKRYIASDDAGVTWYVVTDTSTSTDGKLLQFAGDSQVTGFGPLVEPTPITGSLTFAQGGVSYKLGHNSSFPLVQLEQGTFTKYRGVFQMSSAATAGTSTVRLCMEQQDGTDMVGCNTTYTLIQAVKASGSR